MYLQAVPGVPPIESGYNPATYMLEVSTVSSEERIGRDLSEVYRESQLCRCGGCTLAADTCCGNIDTSGTSGSDELVYHPPASGTT